MVTLARRQTVSGCDKLARCLGFAPVAMYYPLDRRAVTSYGIEQLRISAHGMYHQWFGHFLGQTCVQIKQAPLYVGRCAAQIIESTLAYGHYSRVAGSMYKFFQHGEAYGVVSIPRMDAHTVCATLAQGLRRSYVYDGIAVKRSRTVV